MKCPKVRGRWVKQAETTIHAVKGEKVCEAGRYRTNAVMRAMTSVRRTIAAPTVLEGRISVEPGK
jgi:hypothetical protein